MRILISLFIYLLLSSCTFFTIDNDACEEVFLITEQQPEIRGGLRAIQQRVIYPQDAIDAEIQGRVIVQFIIDSRGRSRDHRITRTLSPSTDQEAIRVISTAEYTPGIQNGVPVCTQLDLPIIFRLRS